MVVIMITKAITTAYQKLKDRKWDTVYWAIDLHDTCLVANYETGGYAWINDSALNTLKLISSKPETKIILWSSVHDDEQQDIIKFFAEYGINVYSFNCNPRESSTTVSCFDSKFYFSILVDDKAGFDPSTDWDLISAYFDKHYDCVQ